MNLYKTLHYYIVPPIFLITTPVLVQYLACIGHEKEFSLYDFLNNLSGNHLTWGSMFIVTLWAVIWLIIPWRKTYGPVTFNNERPEFQDNGFIYYVITSIIFLILQLLWPDLSSIVFWNMPPLISTLNIAAFVLCVYLFMKGIKAPEHQTEIKKLPKIYLFYKGIELHPTILNMQIKQLTNCRFGLMLWQLLVLAFYITGYQRYGFNSGSFVNCFLQTVYLAKFYWWEAGYFWTLDITHDNAGYYICWGCMVFVPMFYTYSSYYLVLHQPIISDIISIIILIIGLVSIIMNYRVDYEKELFQKNRFNDNFKLWSKNIEYIPASYKDAEGNLHETRLLASGCWGLARHLNYFFELLLALSWSLPGIGLGVHTFLYPIFLLVLLVHRCYRDEIRCKEKYGDAYLQYCEKVPYRLIPYIF